MTSTVEARISHASIGGRSWRTGTGESPAGLGLLSLVGCNRIVPTTGGPGGRLGAAKVAQVLGVQHQWVLDAALGGVFYAADEGLVLECRAGGGGPSGGPCVDPVVPVTSGQALVGIHTNAASVILPKVRGPTPGDRGPVPEFNRADGQVELGTPKLENIRGKRIGVVQTSLSVLEAVLKLNGLEGAAQAVVVSPVNDLQVLLDYNVDALVAFNGNQGVQSALQGIPYVFFDNFNDLGYRQESFCFNDETLKERRTCWYRFGGHPQGVGVRARPPRGRAQLAVQRNAAAGDIATATGLSREQQRSSPRTCAPT